MIKGLLKWLSKPPQSRMGGYEDGWNACARFWNETARERWERDAKANADTQAEILRLRAALVTINAITESALPATVTINARDIQKIARKALKGETHENG